MTGPRPRAARRLPHPRGQRDGWRVALQGMTLSVEQGERCVVLGPSGSGKSTLLRIAAGFDRPSAGVARTLGVDVMRLGARRAAAFRSQRLGFLDQHYARALSPALSCAENVALPLALAGVTAAASAGGARSELLDGMGLADRADDLPAALSGGEQQRVAACAALAHAPALLLADEPAGELDAATARTASTACSASWSPAAGRRSSIVSHDEAADGARRPRRPRARRAHQRRGAARRRAQARRRARRLGAAARERARRGRASEGARAGAADEGEVALSGDGAPAPARERTPAEPGRTARSSCELRGVDKRYGSGAGRTVLCGFDALLPRGALVALEGRSGSGKTTMLHLIAGLERPDAGSVERRGARAGRPRSRGARGAPARPHRLGRAGAGADPVRDRARERRARARRSSDGGRREEHEPEVRAWLERLGLDDCIDRAPTASRQASASASRSRAPSPRRPDVVLLDEPTARLDEASAALVADLLVTAAQDLERRRHVRDARPRGRRARRRGHETRPRGVVGFAACCRSSSSPASRSRS